MDNFKRDDYQEGQESKGLGDSIAKFTHAFRIHKVAEAVAKIAGAPGCGCKERREFLNQLFPYQKTVRSFKVLRPFRTYEVDTILEVNRKHPIFSQIIELQRDGVIVELEP